jgi:hypothetical protein
VVEYWIALGLHGRQQPHINDGRSGAGCSFLAFRFLTWSGASGGDTIYLFIVDSNSFLHLRPRRRRLG